MSDVEAGGAPAPAAAETIATNPPPVGQAPETNTTVEDTLGAAWDKVQRNGVDRDDDGKFKSPNQPELKAEAPAEAKTENHESAVEPAKEVEPVKVIDPPNSWTAEARAEWAKLPPSVQEYVLKRESESHKAITSQGERLKSFEPFEGLLTEYRDDFARHAVTPDQGIRALLEAQRMFDRNPLEAATTLLLQRGIDLRPLLAGQQGQVPSADPRVGQLEQRLNQAEQKYEQTLQQQRAAQEAADVAAVNQFAKDKPYFDDVRVLMASLMKDGHAESLQAAYDMAVRAHPEVAKRIELDQRKAAEEKRKAEEAAREDELKKRAQDAAKAAKVNVKSGTAVSTPKSMDDTLDELGRRLFA